MRRRGADAGQAGFTFVKPADPAPVVEATEMARDALLAAALEMIPSPCTGCGKFAFPAPTRCYWCRQQESA